MHGNAGLPDDAALEAALLAMAARRGLQATACPSEVARLLGGSSWRALMPRVRAAATGLALGGQLEITQRGVVIDPKASFKGPIRIRLPRG